MRVLLITTCTPDDRKPVSFSRALARSGARIGIGSDRFWGEAGYSRYIRHRHRIRHPTESLDDFISDLNRHIESCRYDVVLPLNDYTTLGLCLQRSNYSGKAAALLPALEAIRITRDKQRTLAVAQELGIDVPKSLAPENEDELVQAGDEVGYPCVIKLRCGAGAVGYRVAKNRHQLLEAYRQPRKRSDLVFDYEHLLVQEYIYGHTCDVCVLFRHGEPRAVLTQKRLWTYPAAGGVGVIVECTNDPQLADLACRFFRAVEWHGPAQAEFKVDPHTGRTCLIEINGRFWGTIGAAVHAGVNFPLLACRLATDGDVQPVLADNFGQRFRYPIPFGILALMESSPKGQVLRSFFGSSGRTGSDLDWKDPLPLLAELCFAAWRLLRKALSKLFPSVDRWES